jgi:uncharacterized membrane protein (UPF0127 family)
MLKALLVASAALSVAACPHKEEPPPPPGSPPFVPAASAKPVDYTAESFVPPPLPTARVVLKDAYGGSHAVEVEVAATDHSRMRGLMWRKELAAGKGMLFLFARDAYQSFWMRNTLISLDMIFISKDMKIAGIVENTTPRSLESRGVSKPSSYVLEVPAGWSQKVGIRAGSPVEFVGTQELVPEP